MPELPEVETLRRDAETTLVGRRIVDVELLEPRVVQHPDPQGFEEGLRGRRLVGARRKAKVLLLDLDGGLVWAVHLKVQGQLLLVAADAPRDGTVKLVATLDGAQALQLRDVARLAKTSLLPGEQVDAVLGFEGHGPEPLDPAFTRAHFREMLAHRRGRIKPLLMDQDLVPGNGNIYADEALFRVKVHPETPAGRLTPTQLDQLHDALQAVLREGLATRGCSAKGLRFVDLLGRKGHFQDHLRVYRREGEPCPGCSGTVACIRVSGRISFFCPSCQPAPG